MLSSRFCALAAALVAAASIGTAHATVLVAGDSARVNYAPGPSGPGTPPFSFIALGFNFASSNPFGPNETLKYSAFSPSGTLLGSATVSAGNSVYTSGIFGALTQSIFPPSPLTSTSFYAIVTDLSGSFDLTGGQADLYNFAGGQSEFGAVGTVVATAVPEPATWAMILVGFGVVGSAARYRRRKSTTAYR